MARPKVGDFVIVRDYSSNDGAIAVVFEDRPDRGRFVVIFGNDGEPRGWFYEERGQERCWYVQDTALQIISEADIPPHITFPEIFVPPEDGFEVDYDFTGGA